MAGKHIQKKAPVHASERDDGRRTQRRDYEQPAYRADSRGRGRRGTGRASRRHMKWAIPVLIVLVLVVAGLGSVMAYASHITKTDTIYPNVSVNGVDVGGLTVRQAAEKLEREGANPYKGKSVTVRFPLDYSLTVTAEELGCGGDTTVPAEAAYAYGRNGSTVENVKSYLACRTEPVEMAWDVGGQLDEQTLRQRVSQITDKVNTELLEAEAEIGEEGITLIKGMSTAKVDGEAVCQSVLTAFREQVYDDIECELADIQSGPDGASAEADILQSVYDTIYTEPVNAMYDKETGGATESVRGVSFDMDEARRLWDEAQTGDEVFIPFIFTEPEIDAETLLERLFADCLAEKSTTLSGSSSNRINNITLAAQALNGTVINPGETFDYNTCLGERTTAKGYKEAGAYSGGKHVTNVGGGICQDSSTLYYCALYANLKITVRDNHYFVVSYLPWGLDATVSWGGPDFRFVNSRDYPIKIKAWVSGGYLTVQLWGTDVDGSYVKMTSDTWEDSEYYYAQTYRAVYAADGTQLSYTKEAYSRYHKYEAGEETPAPEEDSPTPKPTETAPPTPTATAAVTATDPPPVDTQTPPPTAEPTAVPTAVPTSVPTAAPTSVPTPEPPPPEITDTSVTDPPAPEEDGGE